jgi:hypothetical protein
MHACTSFLISSLLLGSTIISMTHTHTCRHEFAPLEHQREFSYVLNSLIRSDDAEAAPHIAVVVRAINTLLVSRRSDVNVIRFPPNGVTYRGGGLPDAHRDFFQAGKKYRVPGFLATSFARHVVDDFMLWADQRGERCVLWEIHVDPEGDRFKARRCMHVSYVEHRALGVPLEEEYLFAPYAPFTVREVCAHSFPPRTPSKGLEPVF